MIKCMILVFISLSSIGCNSESMDPHMRYFAAFDGSKIEMVESAFDDIARRNNLKVFKKDRRDMQALSHDKEAFFTALYFQGDPVLTLTNAGVPDKLIFVATDYAKCLFQIWSV